MMHTTQRNLTVTAIISKELYSSASKVYHPHAFALADNQQNCSEILLEKYHLYKRLSFVYKDLCQIVLEGNNLHLVDN